MPQSPSVAFLSDFLDFDKSGLATERCYFAGNFHLLFPHLQTIPLFTPCHTGRTLQEMCSTTKGLSLVWCVKYGRVGLAHIANPPVRRAGLQRISSISGNVLLPSLLYAENTTLPVPTQLPSSFDGSPSVSCEDTMVTT